jgi:general secretion pathway protein K
VRQQGVALITALVLVAIATVLAVHIGTRASLDLRRTAGLVALDQGWHVALGAEAWAAEVLKNDLQDSQTDDLSEAWAQPLPPLPVDGGSMRGALEDMQGRFNINNLLKNDGSREADLHSVARFGRLLNFAGANPRWAPILADWLDGDTISGIPEGAEDGTYLAQNPPYRAANRPVTSVSEMLALPGMTLEEYQRIRPYIAALPVGTTINVCTAAAPVLAAMIESSTDFGDAEALASNRRDGCFPRIEDLKSDPEFSDVESLFSETSNWFRAVTAVRIGTSELTLYSLIERYSTGGSRTVLRSTGTE